MNNIHVIFSQGRTGSHIILEMLTGNRGTTGGLANACAIWLPLNKGEYLQHVKNHNVVIHLHDLSQIKELDPKNITLITSLRRDIFAQTMSTCIADMVDEWNGKEYSNKIVAPVVFDKRKFINLVKRIMASRKTRLDLSSFKKVVIIYYEDLVEQGAKFLASELSLDYKESQVGHVHQSSPYRYKDIILNWEELYQEYLEIMQNQTLPG
jgi:hypothetical protein